MRKLILLIICLWFTLFIQAQNPAFQWVKNLHGSGVSSGSSINLDAFGMIYTTGNFYGVVDFDPSPNTFTLASKAGNIYDIFITKFDDAGNFVWAKSMGGASQDNAKQSIVNNYGDIYTTGSFKDTADFNPALAIFSLTSNGNDDVYISKLDAAGNFVWAKSVGGVNTDYGTSISLDIYGNVILTGSFQGTVDFDPGPGTFNITSNGASDIFILKLNNSGEFVWAKTIGGSIAIASNAITPDLFGNIYCTGYFWETIDFNPGVATNTLTSKGQGDIFILKLDELGNFIWVKSMGGIEYESANAITLDATGNIYTTGSFRSTADFDPGAGIYNLTTSPLENNIFISKLDASGNFVWAKQLTGNGQSTNAGLSINIDVSGNVFTTGYFQGKVDFDPGPGSFTLTSSSFYSMFILKLNSSGSYMWAGKIAGPNRLDGRSIKIDALGNIYTIGNFVASADFDPGPGIFNLNTLSSDCFILRLSACCEGINEISINNKHVAIYPNPNNGDFNINIEEGIESPELIIFNTLGQIAFKQKLILGPNKIKTNGLVKGLYYCRLISKEIIIEIGSLAIE